MFRLKGLVPEWFGSSAPSPDRQTELSKHPFRPPGWKFWNSHVHKALCPSRGFSIPLYLLNKHQLEIPQEKLTLEAKKCCFQLQCESNPELRRKTTDIYIQQLWIPNIFFLKLHFWTPVPLWDDKNIVERAVTFPSSPPMDSTSLSSSLTPVASLNPHNCLGARSSRMCRGNDSFQGNAGSTRVTCKVCTFLSMALLTAPGTIQGPK